MMDPTLHQTLTGHQDGYQSWWPRLSKFKCPVLISNKHYQIINQILGYSISPKFSFFLKMWNNCPENCWFFHVTSWCYFDSDFLKHLDLAVI
jgi:hypothetical protein